KLISLVPKLCSFLHVKSQCLEGEVVATRNGVYSASTEIQDLRRLTKKAVWLGNTLDTKLQLGH
ncbi:MAG TPA: hypothetical protein VNQ76_16905, partial [Planctomicrobium sp.]|nr:hypothetical protein [Planctomicrobium sp.]